MFLPGFIERLQFQANVSSQRFKPAFQNDVEINPLENYIFDGEE